MHGDLSDRKESTPLCYMSEWYNRAEAPQGLCGGWCHAVWMRSESKASEESLDRGGSMWHTAEEWAAEMSGQFGKSGMGRFGDCSGGNRVGL